MRLSQHVGPLRTASLLVHLGLSPAACGGIAVIDETSEEAFDGGGGAGGGSNGLTCGEVTCPVDTYCCNESCGICAGLSQGCVALECD